VLSPPTPQPQKPQSQIPNPQSPLIYIFILIKL